MVYAAGEALGVAVDWVRRVHVLRLLGGGDDVLAEDLLVQVNTWVGKRGLLFSIQNNVELSIPPPTVFPKST